MGIGIILTMATFSIDDMQMLVVLDHDRISATTLN
jgi:hypothetical protein